MNKIVRAAILALALIAGFSPAFAQAPPPVPALPDAERRTSYVIAATTCICNVNFALYGDSTDYAAWVEVYLNGVRVNFNDGTFGWTITSPTGALGSIPRPVTDAVLTFNGAQTGTVQIVGARRPRRTSTFAENRGVAARDLNQILNDMIAQNRETWDKTNDVTGRALMSQPGNTLGLLPLPAACVNGFIGFDATGLNPLCRAGGAGSGNVVGPLSSTAGDVALFANATGTLLSDAGGGAVSHPIAHPSSGNLVGSGCITAEAHSIWWIDQNLCSTSDVWQITSSDPSAVFTATIGGTRTTGDKVTLNFTFGSGVCVAGASPACDASYTAIAGDTLQNIANGLVCAIANNPNLFRINGGSCASGAVTPAVGQNFGGYASGSIIGYVVQITNGVAFDFNSNVALKVTSSVTGAATETVTIGNTNCGTRCSFALDNNPAFQMVRNSGGAPQPGSTLNAIYSIGASSACPTSVCVNYGNITNWVGNSTSGALSSAWLLQTPAITGAFAGGMWVGQGTYSNVGGAPFSATAAKDMGAGTFNVGVNGCYYLGYTNSLTGDGLCQNVSGQLTITTNTDNIILSSAAGVGINTSPTGNTFQSALGGFFSGTQVPTTNIGGVGLAGGTTPAITYENYGTSTFLAGSFVALSVDFKPSNSATSGFTVKANEFGPDADNVSALGDATHSFSQLFLHGTSGGIPYWSNATTISASGALSSGALVLGGGAGGAPTTSAICSQTGLVFNCNSSSNSSPTFQFMNSAADASSGLVLYDKSRSGGNSLNGDTIAFFVFRGFANGAQQNSAAIKATQQAASSGSNIPTQISLQTSNAAGLLNQNLNFDNNAHLSAVQASAPTLTAGCNGAGSSVSGTDLEGTATGQTAAATTCTLTFGTAFAAAPNCIASGLSSPLTGAITPATGTLVVSFASTANYKFSWHCMGA